MDSFGPGCNDWERDKRITKLEKDLMEFKNDTENIINEISERLLALAKVINDIANFILKIQDRIFKTP